jgi:hypothetical protein
VLPQNLKEGSILGLSGAAQEDQMPIASGPLGDLRGQKVRVRVLRIRLVEANMSQYALCKDLDPVTAGVVIA